MLRVVVILFLGFGLSDASAAIQEASFDGLPDGPLISSTDISDYGTFALDVSEAASDTILPLNIEITKKETEQRLFLLPGAYYLLPGDYKIQVYRSSINEREPNDRYETIVDEFSVAAGHSLTRNYHSPRRRLALYRRLLFAVGPQIGYVSDNYLVPNPLYTVTSSEGSASTFTAPAEIAISKIDGASPINAGIGLNAAWFTNYMGFMFEGDVSYRQSADRLGMAQLSGDLGIGQYWQIRSWFVWVSANLGYESVEWLNLSIATTDGSLAVSHSLTRWHYGPNIGLTPRKGGLTILLGYRETNAIAYLNVAWNFGREHKKYSIPEITKYEK